MDYIDRWYPIIEDLTFPTSFLHLTIDEAQSLLAFCRLTLHSTPPTPSDRSHYESLRLRLCSHISSFPDSFRKGFFAKLAWRSPKDSVYLSPSSKSRFLAILLHEYRKYANSLSPRDLSAFLAGDQLTPVDARLSFICETEALKCCTADEILDLFTHSKRIMDDLESELATASPDLLIVVREWEERLCPLLEFRGFVVGNQLNALSQYCHWVAFDAVLNNREKIEEHIRKFFRDVVRLRFEDNRVFDEGKYVVDLLVIMKGEEIEEVKIIEMNRLGETTGGALFTWDDDKDVFFGKRMFEFRVVTPGTVRKEHLRWWVDRDFPDWKKHCLQVIKQERNLE